MKKLSLILLLLLMVGCSSSDNKENNYTEYNNEVPIIEEEITTNEILVPTDYQTISQAIEASEDGDIIIVSPGVYNENINFSGKNITLKSTNPTDQEIVESTVINGTGTGPVIRIDSGERATLNGFTITGGDYDHGGALNIGPMMYETSPTIINNIFKNNNANYGGAIYVHISKAIIKNNTFTNNTAGNGGAIYVSSQGNVTIEENQFISNNATRFGGAISISMENPTIKNNSFTNNTATTSGGAISLVQSNPVMEGNVFNGNSPDDVN